MIGIHVYAGRGVSRPCLAAVAADTTCPFRVGLHRSTHRPMHHEMFVESNLCIVPSVIEQLLLIEQRC